MCRVALLLIFLGGCGDLLGLGAVEPPPEGPPPGVWKQVAAGDHFTCAVTTTNLLYCWGYNGDGELGASRPEAQIESPVQVTGTWTSVALGRQHGCAISGDGSLSCWGQNFAGQLGSSVAGAASVPTAIAAPRTQWTSVAAFDNHTCAIASDQTLWCWGTNSSRQSDPNGTNAIAPPTQIDVGAAWQAVSIGVAHSCGLTVDGVVWCWGANSSGQSGITGNAPVVPPSVVEGTYTALSAGDDFTCAIDAQSHASCWGTNHVAQLARGGPGGSQPSPALVAGNSEYTAISASWNTACALTTANGLECWGDLTGIAPAANVPTPLGSGQWRQLSVGRTHVCSIDTSGGLSCAGDNTAGQLAQIAPDTTVPQMIIASAVTNIALGDQFGCAVISIAGKSACWGDNTGGELATGDYLRRLTPSPLDGVAFAQLALGGDHACGIDGTKHAMCWGNNPYGGLGNGTTTGALQPVQLSLTTVTLIALGDQHTCATASGANGVCFGRGLEGQLATNAKTSSSTPVVMTLTAGGVSNISAGYEFTCWIEAGKVYCAGTDTLDQLGNGDSAGMPRVSVGAGSFLNVVALAAGREHVCAVAGTSNGKDIYCWGRNYEGELGNGTTTKSSAIPSRVGTIAIYTAVASGEHHSCGLTTTGTVQCWGHNDRGQLGDGTRLDRVSPVAVTTDGTTPLGGVTAIAAGGSTTCALVGGALECWGDNGYGALGVSTGWLNDFAPVALP